MALTDPAGPLQTATVTALKGSADVQAAFTTWSDGVVRVYDRVPADAATGRVVAKFPYVTVGEDHIIGAANGCHDNSEAWTKVEVWSRPSAGSKLEVKALAAAVRAALDASLTVAGFNVVTHRHHDTIYRREPDDGLTERAIVTTHYLLEPA